MGYLHEVSDFHRISRLYPDLIGMCLTRKDQRMEKLRERWIMANRHHHDNVEELGLEVERETSELSEIPTNMYPVSRQN